MPTPTNRLIQHVLGNESSTAERRVDKGVIDWFTLTTDLGPSRFGFDFERVELVQMRKRKTIIDLARRQSYGLHILSGSCLVAWRERGSATSLSRTGRTTPEIRSEFEKRVGRIVADPTTEEPHRLKLAPKNNDITYAQIPFPQEQGESGPRREIFFGSAFELTLISETNDVLLAVFSSDGPGNPSSSSPQPHSTS